MRSNNKDQSGELFIAIVTGVVSILLGARDGNSWLVVFIPHNIGRMVSG